MNNGKTRLCLSPIFCFSETGWLLIALIFGLAASLKTAAQNPFAQASKGTDFWVGFSDNLNSEDPTPPITLRLFITADESTNGTVTMPGTGWSESFSVSAGSTSIVVVPTSEAMARNSEVVEQRGIHIESENPVSVYALNHKRVSSDATIILPSSTLGSRYRVMSYEPSDPVNPSQLLIVATADNSALQVIPSSDTESGHPAGLPMNINLDRGETFLVESTGDLTGTLIQNQPNASVCRDFAVFSGARCVNVPTACNFCDHLYQQMPPISAWGKRFPAVPFATRGGDLFRVLAHEPSTVVDFGSHSVTLQAGEFYDTLLASPGTILAGRPIAVAQYSLGGTCDGVIDADPFIILLNPSEQDIESITFPSFSSSVITEYFITLIVNSGDLGSASLDGSAIPVSEFSVLPGSTGLHYAQLSVDAGNHNLEAPNGLSAYVYGFGEFESYGYTAGTNLFTLANAFELIWNGDTSLYYNFDESIPCNREISMQVDSLSGWTYFWSFGDGNTTMGTSVSHLYETPGQYELELIAEGPDFCTGDTLRWEVEVAGVDHSLPVDTALCPGGNIWLEWDHPDAEITWPDGSQDAWFELNSPGNYTVLIQEGFCVVEDSIRVSEGQVPVASWPTRPIVCPSRGTSIELDPGPHAEVIWESLGLNASSISVSEPGMYAAWLTSNDGCIKRAEIEVEESCEVEIVAPNVFSPNGDGLHDGFRVFADNLLEFEMEIYDRWGEVIFRSDLIDTRWDGTYRGRPQETGTYVWKVLYRDIVEPGSLKAAWGHVTIIR